MNANDRVVRVIFATAYTTGRDGQRIPLGLFQRVRAVDAEAFIEAITQELKNTERWDRVLGVHVVPQTAYRFWPPLRLSAAIWSFKLYLSHTRWPPDLIPDGTTPT